MKRLLLPILLTLMLTGCGFPTEPMLDDTYPRDIHMTDGYEIILEGASRVWVEFRPDIDFETVRAHGKPTWVTRGVFGGFSLPIFAADNEELYLDICVPNRWDDASDIYVHIDCWVDAAQDAANDAFNLQIEWEYYTPDVDIVPNTSNPVAVEITTGVCAQFQSFQVQFVIPFAGIVGDDEISFRVTRIAVVVGNEMAGEVVINHVGMVFRFDEFGDTTAP